MLFLGREGGGVSVMLDRCPHVLLNQNKLLVVEKHNETVLAVVQDI